MNLVTRVFFLIYGTCYFVSGYNFQPSPGPEYQNPQADVQAPAYVPSYAKNPHFANNYARSGYGTKTGYTGTKTGYTGTKTGYTGTKTGYTGTKTGYTGTKTGYTGTKTGYTGTKTGYPGTKNGYGYTSGYSESKTWYSNSGNAPTYQDIQHSANMPYTAVKCEPECMNTGICVAPNQCKCPPNFSGRLCEFEKKPCLTYPPMPVNSMRRCNDEMCTITCLEGHRFPDGSTVANMRCSDGQWQPTRTDLTSVPDCQPECSPPCLNGGVCLSVNTCQCPTEYRGPQCQYSTSVCDFRKLAFNGNYKCKGDAEEFSCLLSCPVGASPSTPLADKYTCLYSTGVFLPQPIPHCVFEEVIIVTPSNYHSGFSNSYYETYFHNNSQSESQTGVKKHSPDGTFEYGKHGVKNNVDIVVQDFTPKGGTCLTWAGVHYKTFDGKIYSFESPCQHILVRDAKEHEYTIAVKQGTCERKDYCPLELTVYLEDKPYFLATGEEEGTVVFRSSRRLIPIPASLPGIRVSMPNGYVLVNLDTAGIVIKWDTNNVVVVEGSVLLWNNTQGLCGLLDGNPDDDFLTKDGTLAKTKAVLAASWQLNKIGDVCDSTPSAPSACASKSDEDMRKALQFCTKVFSKEKFRQCSKVMDVTQLLETCQWDYCACTMSMSPEECACTTVAVYAKECQRLGVQQMSNWRDADTCPMHCPESKLYNSCGPDVQPSCQFPEPSSVDNATCVEGCFCPKGLLLEAGRCIPKEECPCRLRNKSFKPGSVVPKECNTCTCQAGEWTCTAVPCGARCSAVGDPHYTTFDGLRYDFMGHCTYTLLRAENVTVEVENVACSGAISEEMNLIPSKGTGKPSCTKAVNLKYSGVELHLKQGGFVLVNGKEVASLPVHVGGVLIRAASSLFLIVQLPNGLDLWWDGNTRVFVDVPAEFHDKTLGLCGTFNLNQKDDFLTPEGDIEQSALAFANKWKTRELCQDVDTAEPEHPCKANMENKEAAEKYCSKLMSKLFEPCHWFVSVTSYYEACVYDMCACAGDASRCLCPILGDYAMACAKQGVKIQWRYNVKECELSCGGGQEYTVCADSCQRTCSDVALATRAQCRPRCVEGCACPHGQVLDSSNVCVPLGLCPCYHKGLPFDAGYKEVRAGRRERELCTCVGAHWECVPASPQDIQNYPPAEDLRSNCSSLLHKEFTTCEVAEPLTCKNMHLPPSTTTKECRPGCQCKKGYVLDASSDKCVLAAECPCHHGGRSFPDGHEMQEECNTCKCVSGNWSCTEKQCAGVCSAWGDSHVTTFDGREYEFEGVCTYLLAKGCADAHDGFEVQIQNAPCGTTGATCSKSITLKVGNAPNEEIALLTKDAPLPDLSKLERIKRRVVGAYVFLDVPSLGMSLQWDRGMRVYVKVDAMWRNRVKGLCGNYNSDSRDDFQKPEGGIAESSVLIFADSWKLKPTCPKTEAVKDHCRQRPERKDWATTSCGALKRHPFTLCHSEVPPTPYIEQCERDACACDAGDDCACVCTALAAYAHRCAARGVVFKWRTKEQCPMQCDETCESYEPCMSPCPQETCENTYYYKEIQPVCERDTCVEGCKKPADKETTCPEGHIVQNSTSSECVPRAQCKPVCMSLKDGREVLDGEVIEQDACHTCRCVKKQRVCIGLPCSTETELPTPTTPASRDTTPYDQPLKCLTGWTSWINRGAPETVDGHSVDREPLPKPNELSIGRPMCEKDKVKAIDCRTVDGHKSPKETGLNVECSLERGLVCDEVGKECPDFEIQVFCQCEDEDEDERSELKPTPPPPFQCLNSSHPNHPHPNDCSKFYECTPELMDPKKPHEVVKDCPPGLLYSKKLMICDWPASVLPERPECKNDTKESREMLTAVPVSVETSGTVTVPTTTQASTTPSLCPPGQVYKKCAYPCDNLCDHFKKTLELKDQCTIGKKCVEGCVDEAVAGIKCEFASRWRDEKTCVPLKDCTCYSEGKVVKPGGVVNDGCIKCQCLDNELHCDRSECVSQGIPSVSPSSLPMIMTERTILTTTPRIVPTTTAAPSTTVSSTTVSSTTVSSTTVSSTTVPSTTSAPFTTLIIKSVVTPPPECNPDRYKNLLWEGAPLPASSFTASSVANEHFEPSFAKLNGEPKEVSAGSWNPAAQDTNQYIQVELPRPTPVYGVLMQGNPLLDQYVTSYEVMYGDDGHAFSPVEGADGKPQVFRGPIDHSGVAKQMFTPFEAKFVRIRPLTWHDAIAVRFELIGCDEVSTTTTPRPTTTVDFDELLPLPGLDTSGNVYGHELIPLLVPEPIQCTEPLGLAADLPLESIEVSSNNQDRKYFALTAERGWRPLYSTPGEWIMFDFTSPRNITGVKTKGGVNGWVTTYNIMYTSDLTTFNPVIDESGATKIFPANFDKDSVVVNEFRPPIHARYLKVLPLKWKDAIEMRVEPIGCFEPYPTATVAPTQSPLQATTEACVLCPGIPATSCDCHNATAKYFDGDSCVSRDQCPCVEGFMTYAVGSAFHGLNCDECVCKLGGVTDCKPVKECACDQDLVPKLTSTCECLCTPCAPGTKICPTSKLCLPLEKWCDGLQDCPDDERACTTTPPTVTTTVEPTVVSTAAPTVAATLPTTTEKPQDCPVVECPPGYLVRLVAPRYRSLTSDLPPPRPRQSYNRYYRGGAKGYSRGGYSKGGYSKGGYSKGGFAKGGYGQAPQLTPVFSLEKAAQSSKAPVKECQQFKCVPKLPPLRPGATAPPQICSTPVCPPGYSLKLEAVPVGANQCPQYGCTPPPERPVYCNVTGRTFTTFDGHEYKYDVCFHILARDVSPSEAWTVLVRKKCRVSGCQNELLVRQDDQLILVKPSLMIEYDNYEYTVDQTKEICFQKNSFDISQLGNGLAIKSRKYNFTVLYNKDGDVKIGLYKTHKGYVDGLCGFFDGNPSNDLRLPGGGPARSVDEFGRGWAKPGLSPRACRTSVIPPERQRRAWDLCDVITKEPLSKCGKVLNLDMWRSICLEKLCKCTDLVVNGTKRTEEECRCLLVEQLVAECLAADKDLDVAGWRMALICPAECPPPLVHYECYSKACEPACSTSGAARQACPAEPGHCFPGCYCPAGTLRQGDACIPPQECLDCECHGLGTPAKYTTFEGDDMPFLGNCTYLASRDRNETGVHKYEVYATNGPCEEKTSAVCTKAVHVVYGKNVIHIRRDPVTKKLVTTIGEEVVYKYPVKKNWVTINSPNKRDVTVELLKAFVELSVQQAKMEFAVRVPSHVYGNATEGLCGVCAGYQEELVTSNGTVTDDFELYGKSWEAAPASLAALALPPQEQCDQPTPEPECVPLPPEDNQCLNLYDKDKFGPCHALVDPEPFAEACEADVCANATDICAALDQYSSACRRQGVCLDWRTKLCPLACEAPLVYRTCVDCERTCDNYDELAKDPKKCGKQPMEGCFCPEGKVRVNNTCIEPTKCFPCDANHEHYAGDEWQEDACSKCTCSKQPGQNVAHVSCTKMTCSPPVCSPEEDLLSTPRVGACCNDYLCVPKPKVSVCKEPKKMECGFGQVLKQKTTPDGCTEFACECKPASECEHIPTSSEVELMPGMARVVDTSGCCPRVQMLCRPDTCPEPSTCPPHHEAKATNVSGTCCPQHECVLPADKCLVTLEWEAATKGGEKARDTPQTMLKDVEAAWLDGPCRSCRCEGAPPAARCSVTECPPIATSDQFVVEARPVPFACCPVGVQVACRAGDTVYRVGENWTSPHDVCESYQCIEVGGGQLERVTTVQTCPDNCEPGWKYFPAEPGTKQCCGKCKPVACICSGVEHAIGATWRSADHCTNYTCVDVDGTLQVQTSNETCPSVSVALRKQFVLKEEKPEGKCCNTSEPVACRVGNDIYQEGQTWPSSDPCTNYSCARDGTGRLAHAPRVQSCVTECKRGWVLEPPPQGVCCGHCRQAQCVVDNEYIDTGSTWQSADNCTTYTCERDGDSVLTTSARVACPDVSACAPEDLVNETCCQVCAQKPTENLSTCVPLAIPAADTVGLVRTTLRGRGACVNVEPVGGFKECRGTCGSGTVYNNQTGSHDSKCECCQATQYTQVTATLRCADGSSRPHVLASPARCACRACGPTLAKYPAKTGYSGVKTPTKREDYDYDIPEIYARMGSEPSRR